VTLNWIGDPVEALPDVSTGTLSGEEFPGSMMLIAVIT
jgi:hypothetical protein